MTDDANARGVRIASGKDGVSVFGAETGQELNGIANLSVQFAPGGLAIATADLLTDAVEIEGATLQLMAADPASAELKVVDRIEFADGTSWVAPKGPMPDGPYVTEMISYTGLDGHTRKIKGMCLVRGPLRIQGVFTGKS